MHAPRSGRSGTTDPGVGGDRPGRWRVTVLRQAARAPDFGREFFTHLPYVEWYPNTILIDGSPARLRHAATYGADFPYERFRPQFETAAVAWSADAWADVFHMAGARYVVLVTRRPGASARSNRSAARPDRSRSFSGRLVLQRQRGLAGYVHSGARCDARWSALYSGPSVARASGAVTHRPSLAPADGDGPIRSRGVRRWTLRAATAARRGGRPPAPPPTTSSLREGPTRTSSRAPRPRSRGMTRC